MKWAKEGVWYAEGVKVAPTSDKIRGKEGSHSWNVDGQGIDRKQWIVEALLVGSTYGKAAVEDRGDVRVVDNQH